MDIREALEKLSGFISMVADSGYLYTESWKLSRRLSPQFMLMCMRKEICNEHLV